ncbi:MAG: sulfurtransferase [Gammaproteobacteria bacterium]|nr:sulfurtransferase [Gammaproteobacteria bacterium]
MKCLTTFLSIAGYALLTVSTSVFALDKSLITKSWMKTPFELYLDPQEAYNLKMSKPDKVIFLDARSPAELHFTGMPETADINIPYTFSSTQWKMKRDGIHGTFKRVNNYNFTETVENYIQANGFNKNSPIIIQCTSGVRAPYAARALHKTGFTKVYIQVEGFEGRKVKSGPNKGKRVVDGWKNAGLPWSYNLLPHKMYFNYDDTLELIDD